MDLANCLYGKVAMYCMSSTVYLGLVGTPLIF